MTTFVFLKETDLHEGMFSHFRRRQVVQKCKRKIDGEWIETDNAFVDDWKPEDYQGLIKTLQNILAQGGMVVAAFSEKKIKGFAAVKAGLFGANQEYLELKYIHVSEDVRGQGIGKVLFGLSKDWAKSHGAGKLYISAHSSVESQAFYQAMGCREALEYSEEHVKKEPYDCQLEYSL